MLWIESLRVPGECNCSGIGTAIIDAVKQMARAEGYSEVRGKLHGARGFWEKMGFTIVEGREILWRPTDQKTDKERP